MSGDFVNEHGAREWCTLTREEVLAARDVAVPVHVIAPLPHVGGPEA